MEAQPGALKAHHGSMVAHSGAMEAHPWGLCGKKSPPAHMCCSEKGQNVPSTYTFANEKSWNYFTKQRIIKNRVTDKTESFYQRISNKRQFLKILDLLLLLSKNF
jgi:hypothetical protein